jgi:hypothetical protein
MSIADRKIKTQSSKIKATTQKFKLEETEERNGGLNKSEYLGVMLSYFGEKPYLKWYTNCNIIQSRGLSESQAF